MTECVAPAALAPPASEPSPCGLLGCPPSSAWSAAAAFRHCPSTRSAPDPFPGLRVCAPQRQPPGCGRPVLRTAAWIAKPVLAQATCHLASLRAHAQPLASTVAKPSRITPRPVQILFGRTRPLGRRRSRICRTRSNSAGIGPKVGRHRPKFWPSSVQLWPQSIQIRPVSAKLSSTVVERGQVCVDVDHRSRFGPYRRIVPVSTNVIGESISRPAAPLRPNLDLIRSAIG